MPEALTGVTVVDLATFLAAPMCATLLGEFGAEVIKVEQPGGGDDLRRLGRPVAPDASSYWWFVEARNKKSITCNLRAAEGQALVTRLAAAAHAHLLRVGRRRTGAARIDRVGRDARRRVKTESGRLYQL